MLKAVENPNTGDIGSGVMVTPEGGYVVAQPDLYVLTCLSDPVIGSHDLIQGQMAEASLETKGYHRCRSARKAPFRPFNSLPDRQQTFQRCRQDALLWDRLLRGLHSDTPSRTRLCVSQMWQEDCLVG